MNILLDIIALYLVYLLIITFIPFITLLIIVAVESVFKQVLGYKPILTSDYIFDTGLYEKIVHYFLFSAFIPITAPVYIIACIIKWYRTSKKGPTRVKIEFDKADFKSILFEDDHNKDKIGYEIRKQKIIELCKFYDAAIEIEPTVGDGWMRAIITPYQDMADYELLEFGDKLEKIWNERKSTC